MAKTCKWIKDQKITRDKLVLCSYLGRDLVVCCNDAVPSSTIKQVTTTSAGDFYFGYILEREFQSFLSYFLYLVMIMSELPQTQ